jgi:hypothetical protein
VRLTALLVVAAAVAAGCGTKKPDAYAQANTALLDTIPVYPGAAAPRTSASGASNTEFGARDWTLPAHTAARTVLTWYEHALTKRGWKVTGVSAATLRAVRGGAAISVGARGRTLEAIANARGR